MRALPGLRCYGPCPPARAAAAPRGRPRCRRGVGRCLEISAGVVGRRTAASFVPGSLEEVAGGGIRGLRCPTRRRRSRANFVGNLAPRSQGGPGGGSAARCAPAACCSSRLPLASAPPRAPGSDVTKPVSPFPPARTPSPLPWCSWDRLGASNSPSRPLGARSGQL